MNNLLKEYIEESVKIQLHENVTQRVIEYLKNVFNHIEDKNTNAEVKMALLAALMIKFGFHRQDLSRILSIRDPEVREVEIRDLADRAMSRMKGASKEDKNIFNYLYFGAKPKVY